MRFGHQATITGTAILGVLLSGCGLEDNRLGVTEPGGGGLTTSARLTASQELVIDDPFAAHIAARVPAFAGWYREGEVLNVYLTDLAQSAVARPALIAELQRHGRAGLTIRILQARHSRLELRQWNAAALSLLGTRGVVYSGIHEQENGLRIGVVSSAARAVVEQQLLALQIPRDAVSIEITRPFRLNQQALTHHNRPLRGGIQVTALYNSGGVSIEEACTYGVNALFDSKPHMIMSSHCTQPGTWGLIGAHIYQPFANSKDGPHPENRIGTEVQDPASFPCSSNPRCRYSDAALVELFSSDPSSWDHGGIARPEEGPVYPPGAIGSTFINSSNPRIELAGVLSDMLVGDTVEKIGRASGWTGGRLDNTCLNITVTDDGQENVLLCQGTATLGGSGGDSGAPYIWRSYTGSYFLVGIHVGGPQFFLGGVFSRWDRIDDELGVVPGDLRPIPSSGGDPDPGHGGGGCEDPTKVVCDPL